MTTDVPVTFSLLLTDLSSPGKSLKYSFWSLYLVDFLLFGDWHGFAASVVGTSLALTCLNCSHVSELLRGTSASKLFVSVGFTIVSVVSSGLACFLPVDKAIHKAWDSNTEDHPDRFWEA